MKRWFVTFAALSVVFAGGGFMVAASGIVPIKASSGHFALTEWFLQFAKRRSVATHTLTTDTPTLKQPWLILKGAGHYESGCSPCHGSPILRYPVVAQAMLPRPPDLVPRIAEWRPEELFYIVKHGIKLTGMPAWPSQRRDDEVLAMVAFLLELPNMDAGKYRRLVHGETAASARVAVPLEDLEMNPPDKAVTLCARCHGLDGQGRGVAAFPKLAGQQREYLWAALQAFAQAERHSGIMQPIAASLSLEQMHELSNYYSRLASHPSAGARTFASAIDRGRTIANHGIPSQRVPSCRDCHGPGGRRRNPAYPTLAGQYSDYLVLQLDLFKMQQRGGSRYAHLMKLVATRLKPQQIKDVALYYASLPTPLDHASR